MKLGLAVPRLTTLLLYATASLAASSAELRYTLAPDTGNVQLGASTIGVGDLTGDGITEIAVADPSCKVGESFFASGCVYLFDGSDGSLIREFTGEPASGQTFGFSLASLDADGDGTPDLAVGASGHASGSGMAWIYSGLDGSMISKVQGSAGSFYGSALANAGDHDGDGKDDLWVGAPRSNSNRGSVYLQSSVDGSPLMEIVSDVSWSGFGSKLSILGDIDADGTDDLAIASPDYREPAETGFSPTVGRVQILRSSDQQIVAAVAGSIHFELLGHSLATVPDADGDGFSDLLIGSYSGGTCLLCSGTDLSLISDLSLPVAASFQPTAAGGGFDADGDGVSDWLVGSSGLTNGLTDEGPTAVYGGVRILSGNDLSTLFELDSTVSRSGLGATLTVLEGFGVAMGETMLVDSSTEGRGQVQIWEFEQFDSSEPDSDGDGVPDSIDRFPDSNSDPTIVIFGIDSGVENRVDENGVTLADLLAGMDKPKNPRQAIRGFLRGVSRIRRMNRRDLITDQETRKLFWTSVRGLSRNLRR